MSTETIEIFNNSDEWANQLKHALSGDAANLLI